MVFVFGILAAPVLCRLLATAWDQYESDRDRPGVNAVMLGLAALAVILGFPSPRRLEQQVNNNDPTKAVEFLKKAAISGRMLNEYVYGGYLIWADPSHKVFIDGRADVYEPAGVLADYARFVGLKEDPKSILDKYRIDFCLLARDEPVARVLPMIPSWKEIYSDRQSVIFARRS
jgi:hypothetical protein